MQFLLQVTTQPAPVQISALTLLLGSVTIIMALASYIVGQLTPLLAKTPGLANLPIGFKVAVVATALVLFARYCPGIHTLHGDPAELVAEVVLATVGATLGLVHGVGNIFQSSASVNTLNMKLAAAKQP
jgi:hypothetical protein